LLQGAILDSIVNDWLEEHGSQLVYARITPDGDVLVRDPNGLFPDAYTNFGQVEEVDSEILGSVDGIGIRQTTVVPKE
jgi:hypothetical protein